MVTFVLASATILFATLYWLLRRSVKLATDQIKQVLKDRHTNRRIHLHSPDKQLEALLVEVNHMISVQQAERILHERKEVQIRKQIANISHDLRTPLTSILGYIELLQEKPISTEQAEEYLLVVEKRTKALRSLISSFYELSLIEAGDYLLVPQKIDLQVLLKRALADHYPEISAAGFEVVLELADENCFVIADEESVMRIYLNVLQNVLNHGQRSLHLFQGVKDGKLVTMISNETSSLLKEDLPHLFQRSFTANRARTKRNTGLGLAVVKGLMQQMGYDVRAEYHEPLFTVYLEWGEREL
ncbi:sensor histidine kinase [Paenibacillus sp. SYP-B4298]|uniref:sensor histidine kinase n=1 Tax=Paenibacillus sp. SYP-B4298 TaxID=2996034 RepID=UPI0022DE7139|nr:HAMP domain-containing sensor histidine kinase [Paenibacillus sp. SYP-B4298]